MSTAYHTLSPECTAFVPRGIGQFPTQQLDQKACYTPQATSFVPQQYFAPAKRMDSFGDYSNHALQTPSHQPRPNFQKVSSVAAPHAQHFYPSAPAFTPQQSMPQMKMSFQQAQVFQRQPSFQQKGQKAFYPDFASSLGQRQCSSYKNVFVSTPIAAQQQQPGLLALPLDKTQQTYAESTSPMTKSTGASSNYDTHSAFSDEEGLECLEMGNGFESPVHQMARKQSHMTVLSRASTLAGPKAAVKTENGWKKKVKTELCRFWLNGQACENSQKEQGCGFAHGQEELQKKKGLSRQYLTSVCKNFLDHPSKCTYGQRCIFQHPTFDVRKRQNYTEMMQDNARYTAMRLFQDIEGSEVIYINTYAATTPRLSVFKNICSSAKDNGEDFVDSAEEEPSNSTFSRDLFRNASQ